MLYFVYWFRFAKSNSAHLIRKNSIRNTCAIGHHLAALGRQSRLVREWPILRISFVMYYSMLKTVWKIQISRINILLQKISFATRTNYPCWGFPHFPICCKILFLPSGRITLTFRPLRETKLPLPGAVEQKNSIQTLASKKESLRSHVCQARLRLGRQLHVIWDISYFTGHGYGYGVIYYFNIRWSKIPLSLSAHKIRIWYFHIVVLCILFEK